MAGASIAEHANGAGVRLSAHGAGYALHSPGIMPMAGRCLTRLYTFAETVMRNITQKGDEHNG